MPANNTSYFKRIQRLLKDARELLAELSHFLREFAFFLTECAGLILIVYIIAVHTIGVVAPQKPEPNNPPVAQRGIVFRLDSVGTSQVSNKDINGLIKGQEAFGHKRQMPKRQFRLRRKLPR